jgi:hypothetical protein
LDWSVAYVEELGGDVAFPETADTFLDHDLAGGTKDTTICWAAGGERWMRAGITVGLELKADFDYVEWGDNESTQERGLA